MALMGVASLGIGLLPGYATLGILAPILLVLLRCIQGFSVSGESGAAIVLTLEHSPPRHRVLLNAAVNIGIPLGQILITLTLLIIRSAVDEAAFLSWAWRIPFLLGFAVALLGVLIRRRIEESPVFRRAAGRRRPATGTPGHRRAPLPETADPADPEQPALHRDVLHLLGVLPELPQGSGITVDREFLRAAGRQHRQCGHLFPHRRAGRPVRA
jgi:MFS family permease